MNPFMIIIAVLQIAATVYEFCKGNKIMAGVYTCYAIASVLLAIIASQGVKQ